MKYIVGHPGALRMQASLEEARAAADEFRDVQSVKIYEIREVAHVYPRRPKAPPTPPKQA